MLRYLRNLTLVLTLVSTLVLSFGLLGTGLAQTPAQGLSGALPADSVLVLGVQDLATIWDDLGDFRGEFERLGVGEALISLFGDETMDELELEGELDFLELLGQDAWLSLSASSFSPLPAVTALARPDAGAMVTVARLVGEQSARDGASPMSEGDYSFFVMDLDDPDSPFQVLAYGQAGDVVYLSTNPDTLRGVLRRLGGAAEPGLGGSPAYEASLGGLEAGNLYGYLDYAALAALARPLATGMGFDRAVNRLGQALDTLGVSAGVVRFGEDGLETESIQRVDPQGGDSRLLALLSEGGTAPDATSLAPADALSYSSSATH
ncbi:MAG: hypothetical protein M3498_11605, partial [Deinococcota bacterium]|nr:hypothetical protein [Deinococcota bacterium]